MLLKLLHKIQRGVTFPNSFYEARTTLTVKLDKDTAKKRKLHTNFLNEHRCNILKKILAK
jgi:hypothetical protein